MTGKPNLRLVEGATPMDEDNQDSADRRTVGGKILIVSIHSSFLREMRIAYDGCSSAEDAVLHAKTRRYQAIFADSAELKDRITGTRLIRLLRENRVTLTPVFLLAENPSRVDIEHALRRGAAALLPRRASEIEKALSDNYVPVPVSSVPVITQQTDSGARAQIVKLLHNYTGPAAATQYKMVLQKHGTAMLLEEFITALSEFINHPKERNKFVTAAKEIRQ